MGIHFKEIMESFEDLSFDLLHEAQLFLCKETGKSYFRTECGDEFETLPEDLEENERYIEIPHPGELLSGKKVAFDFTYEHLPSEAEKVDSIFRKKGAYARFKNLLERNNLIDQWYEYESQAREKALRHWCEAEGIKIES